LAALGYAQYLPEERYLYTKEALLDRMTMAIGGRVAEDLVFGRVSTGAQNDLERITKMSYAMVVDYGMSERIGYVSFNLSNRDDSPTFDKPYSDDTARVIDEEVKVIIDGIRDRARELLEDKREQLEEMAQALLKKEVLGPKDLVDILGPRPFGEYVTFNGEKKDPVANTDDGALAVEPHPPAAESAAATNGSTGNENAAEGEPIRKIDVARDPSETELTSSVDVPETASPSGADNK
jgi:cell division protease FtsH